MVILYRKRGKLRVGKVSRIALYFAYRWKSYNNTLLIPVEFEMYWRKSFAMMTELAKIAKLFPRVTFPVYSMLSTPCCALNYVGIIDAGLKRSYCALLNGNIRIASVRNQLPTHLLWTHKLSYKPCKPCSHTSKFHSSYVKIAT